MHPRHRLPILVPNVPTVPAQTALAGRESTNTAQKEALLVFVRTQIVTPITP